jgi:hypothetical protein
MNQCMSTEVQITAAAQEAAGLRQRASVRRYG